jgi:hypothetical protein
MGGEKCVICGEIVVLGDPLADNCTYSFYEPSHFENHQCPPCLCVQYEPPLMECPIHGAPCNEPGCNQYGGPHSPCHDFKKIEVDVTFLTPMVPIKLFTEQADCLHLAFNKGKCVDCGMENPIKDIDSAVMKKAASQFSEFLAKVQDNCQHEHLDKTTGKCEACLKKFPEYLPTYLRNQDG